MAKAEATVEELVSMIERGDLRLPEMQRGYVWRAPRVRDLLDSLYRGYPSGAILLWETDEDVPVRDFAVESGHSPYSSTRLLLDGQQRLTSLAAVIRGKQVSVRGRQKPIDLLFNLEHPEALPQVLEVDEEADEDEDSVDTDADSTDDDLQRRFEGMTFIVSSSKLASKPNWVKVSDVFSNDSDATFLKRAGVENFDDPRYEKYSQRLARLRGVKKYVYRMDVLERSLDYDEVTEIFVRVNSLGAKLRSSDLALAQVTAKWRNSLQKFLKFQEECSQHWFPLDLGIHLKGMVAQATDQSKFKTVNSLSLAQLQDAWKKHQRATNFAINFLKSNCGVTSPALLSSPFILITIGMYGERRDYMLPSDESASLRRWTLLANAKGRYSRGSTETFLDQDLAILRDGGSAEQLIDRLRLQVGRLDVTPQELEGKDQRSALFKTMFLAYAARSASDWDSGLTIDIKRSGSQHKIQFHHVFPQKFLKEHYQNSQINDIANLAFIDATTNQRIQAKDPSEYLMKIIGNGREHELALQDIPTSAELLTRERYLEFIAERRKRIASSLNELLGNPSERTL